MNNPTGQARTSSRPRDGAGPAPVDPQQRRAGVRRVFYKLAVGCVLTMLMGGIVLKVGVLTVPSTIIAVIVQITAFVIYFTTSDIMSGYQASDKPQQRDILGPRLRARRRLTGLRFVTGLMLGFIAVASFQRFHVLAYPVPWKVIDPASKRFDPGTFSFSDYRTSKELEHAAQVLFPVGTPKASVDAVLHDVGRGGVKVFNEGPGSKVLTYSYSSSAHRGFLSGLIAWALNTREADKIWFVFVKFNAASQVVGISATVQSDDSGALPYTQISPTATTEPYSPTSPLQMRQ